MLTCKCLTMMSHVKMPSATLASEEPSGGNQHGVFAADFFINQRAVDQKRQRIGANCRQQNDSEILVGHQRAQRTLGDVQVVTAHAEERVGHAERQPIDEAARQKPAAVAQRVVQENKLN